MSEVPSSPLEELEAMRKVAEALDGLSIEGIHRVLTWAASAYGNQGAFKPSPIFNSASEANNSGIRGEVRGYEVFADLFEVIDPSTDTEKALTAGYWFQVVQGQSDFDSYSVNSELKHMGHGISNITRAFNDLIARKPSLVMQIRKSGNTQQARKKYKLTTAGIKTVDNMIEGGGD